jgi:hypothetical protein
MGSTFRTLHIGKDEWKYFVGRKNVVIKYPNENTKKVTVPISMVTDLTEDVHVEFTPAVLPSHVKAFIEKNLLRVGITST